ncbi:UNVERIFIED_CONTAM: hypothetical protein K2H54_004734 [Gekko kuhli]
MGKVHKSDVGPLRSPRDTGARAAEPLCVLQTQAVIRHFQRLRQGPKGGSGFRCGPSGTCEKDGESIPWLEKRPAIVRVTSSSRDVRCDDQTSCPDGQTCCRLSSGAWGCCPFAQAVCCADHIHCCPSGFTCDVATGSCHESLHALPWGPERPADPLQNRDIRCNDTTSCAEGQTCCKSKAGTWSCCQLPNAVCCADHQHCCPSGYTCNLKAQTCEKQQQQPQSPTAKGAQASVWLSPPHAATSGHDVPCDAQHYCHDRQTCCQTSTGGWACCPYNKVRAQAVEDGWWEMS